LATSLVRSFVRATRNNGSTNAGGERFSGDSEGYGTDCPGTKVNAPRSILHHAEIFIADVPYIAEVIAGVGIYA